MNNRMWRCEEVPEVEVPEAEVEVGSRFFPFSLGRHEARNVHSMQVSLIDASELLDSQSLLNAPD